MALRVELVLVENNDEIVDLTITSDDPNEDLSGVSALELYLKVSPKYADDDPTTIVLTSADADEVEILTQTTDEITARAFIPATAIEAPYNRFWHLDAVTASGTRRTAFYGEVDVINV